MKWVALSLLTFFAWSPGVAAAGDPDRGRQLAETHWARCHVVGNFNRFGGIGSTPSFVTVPDMPEWSKAPASATPFTVTPQRIDDLLALARTLTPKNLDQVRVVRGSGTRRRLAR